MTVNIAYHADSPSVGMALNKDLNRYKLFLTDTGLFVTLAFKDKDFTENMIYEKLLSDKLSANLGYVYGAFFRRKDGSGIVAVNLKFAGKKV